MRTENKILLAIILGTLVLVGGVSLLLGKNSVVDAGVLVRETSHTLGFKEAKVTIVEFSDYECPACQQVQPTVSQIISEYKDKSVRFVYRQFPLPQYQNAQLAARAAQSAGLQGKFWEIHEKLFAYLTANQGVSLTTQMLASMAGELNLDKEKFLADLNSDTVKQIITNDQADGTKAGLTATTTFFINGTKFDWGLPLEKFRQEINSRL